MSDGLLTAKELAPLIGLKSPQGWQTVHRWKREGRIPAAVDEPHFLRFDLEEVKASLKARAKKQAKLRTP